MQCPFRSLLHLGPREFAARSNAIVCRSMYALEKSDGTQFQAYKFNIAISLRYRREKLQSESKLDRDLPKRDFLIFYLSASFDDFEPIHIFDGYRGLGDRIAHGLIRTFCQASGNFDFLVKMFAQGVLVCASMDRVGTAP
jgi:hypothetical protein